jgi:hypothetical protein
VLTMGRADLRDPSLGTLSEMSSLGLYPSLILLYRLDYVGADKALPADNHLPSHVEYSLTNGVSNGSLRC